MTLSKSTLSSETIMFALLSTISIFVAMLSFAVLLIHRGVDFLKYGGFFYNIVFARHWTTNESFSNPRQCVTKGFENSGFNIVYLFT